MSARLWIPCVLVAACQTASPLPLCDGDPAGAVGWSVGGGMLEQSDMVLAPEGHEVSSLDEDCTFFPPAPRSVRSAVRMTTCRARR